MASLHSDVITLRPLPNTSAGPFFAELTNIIPRNLKNAVFLETDPSSSATYKVIIGGYNLSNTAYAYVVAGGGAQLQLVPPFTHPIYAAVQYLDGNTPAINVRLTYSE